MVDTLVSAESGVVSGFSSLDQDFGWWRAVLLKTIHPFGTCEKNNNIQLSNCVLRSYCMHFKMLVMNRLKSTWNEISDPFYFCNRMLKILLQTKTETDLIFSWTVGWMVCNGFLIKEWTSSKHFEKPFDQDVSKGHEHLHISQW